MPSVCLSLCPSVPCGLISQKQKKTKNQNGAWVSGVPIFSWKGQRSRSLDVINLKKLPHIWCMCLLMGVESNAIVSGADCKLGLNIVRPNLLSTSEMLGNWTDGRISCRLSVPTFSYFSYIAHSVMLIACCSDVPLSLCFCIVRHSFLTLSVMDTIHDFGTFCLNVRT